VQIQKIPTRCTDNVICEEITFDQCNIINNITQYIKHIRVDTIVWVKRVFIKILIIEERISRTVLGMLWNSQVVHERSWSPWTCSHALSKTVLHMRSLIINFWWNIFWTHYSIYRDVFDVLCDVVGDVNWSMVISHKSRYRYTLLVLFCICTYTGILSNSFSLTACINAMFSIH